MSETVATEMDFQEQVARIKMMQEETRKYVAEQHKLMTKTAKLNRDRWLAPLVVVSSLGGGVLAAIASHMIKGMGE
ncbi:hypothetical protein K6L44_04280 [Gluconacetobacter entanii]|uniref:hypothetical protein n=1 Tax=Gluconacetobacter entanii TaxID=108528 RepID=UPI001C933EF0|nr:hypothetical protein [Gluconacetobacter entanii]MBY4639232.1 hypothetical protein [Gluconacetobacter entanii]MCW4580153.1 hypothetical protein [Gluconacetobacter entanii]MCW4584697.1 hypothetical protein [Gluconacetobacter entanii]MCW4588041.1 hypothetical protein [Gluconacetobacter entanii]